MKKTLWIEWIGIWGSGKSTSIERSSQFLKEKGFKVNNNNNLNFFFKFKIFRYFFYLKIIFSNLKINFFVLFILFKSICRLKIFDQNNKIFFDLIKSFFVCWINRQFYLSKNSGDITLWEGEFHLLPLLKLSNLEIRKIIKKIIQLHGNNSISFILLEIQPSIALKRIIEDHNSGENIRFTDSNFENVNELLLEFINSQDSIINVMKSMNLNFISSIDHVDYNKND